MSEEIKKILPRFTLTPRNNTKTDFRKEESQRLHANEKFQEEQRNFFN